jgi:hypothetical protein
MAANILDQFQGLFATDENSPKQFSSQYQKLLSTIVSRKIIL